MQSKDFVRAIRPLNCIMAAIAVFIGASIAIEKLAFELPVLFGMASAFLICAAGLSINDFFDFEIDLKKGKQKFVGITRGKKQQLLHLALVFFAVGIIISWFINKTAFGIALGISALLIAYSWLLQKQKFVGNVVVALGTALPLVFGAAVFKDFDVVLWLGASALLANWAREIIKDVEDLEADEGKKTTLPMIFKMSMIDRFVGLLVLLAIVVSYMPIALNIFGNSVFLLLVTLANLLFIKAFWEFRSFKASASQRTFKSAMAVALLGFLAGVL